MPALYRTYRPRRFSEVVGQQHIVKTLQNAVVGERVAHAYLFCGGRGLGKTTLARVLARALNCENVGQGAEACLSCRTCLALDAGNFLDLLEVDAASNTGVDNVRSLIESVRFQPTAGKYKIYIVDEAHMLSKGAWNALLKTLEEPPPRTVFILATTEVVKVPATINSRAQRFDFRKFSQDELAQQLQDILKQEHKKLPEEIVQEVAASAQGGMRDALTLLDQVLALGDSPSVADARAVLGITSRVALLELLGLLHGRDTAGLPGYFEKQSAVYFDAQAVVRDLLDTLRELLECKLVGDMPRGDLALAGDWFSLNDLLFLIRQYLRAFKEVTQSPQPYLPFFVASVEVVQKFGGSSQATQSTNTAILAPPSVPPPHQTTPPLKKNDPDTAFAKVVREEPVPPAKVSLRAEQVEAVWSAVCERLRAVNGPLGTLVKNSPITAVETDTVVLGVRYLFHKEQLESTKNRQLIAGTLSELLGGPPVRVAAQFVEREMPQGDPAETLGDALRIFGGELVE